MNIDIERTGNQLTMTVSAHEAELAPTVKSVYNQLRQQVDAKGFRPGKAPNEVVERELGLERVQNEVINAAAEKLFRQAVSEHDIRPISHPHVRVNKVVPYSELELVFTVEVMPEVKLPDYTTELSLDSQPVTVDDSEVDQVLESLRERLAERTEVERPAQTGDEVTLDFHGRKNGETVDGAQETNYPLVLGSDKFIPGFEDEIMGLSSGEEKTFKLQFPDDYAEQSVAGEELEFYVKVHTVTEMHKPTLDDEFAQNAGPFSSLQKLREDITSHLRSEKEQSEERRQQSTVLQQLVAATEVDVPESMVEQERKQLWSDIEKRMQEQGLSREQYIEQSGGSEEELEQEVKAQAQERAKSGLVLTEIARQEGLEVSDDELEVRMQVIAGQYQDEQLQEQLQTQEARRELSNQILLEKTMQTLMQYARQGGVDDVNDGDAQGKDADTGESSSSPKQSESSQKSQSNTKQQTSKSSKKSGKNQTRKRTSHRPQKDDAEAN